MLVKRLLGLVTMGPLDPFIVGNYRFRLVETLTFLDSSFGVLLHENWDCSFVAIKDDGHVLQGVASSFRVREVDYDTENSKNCHEDEVILPFEFFERDGVDEEVDKCRDVGAHKSHSQAARTVAVLPNLARIRSEERGTGNMISAGGCLSRVD